MKRIIPALVLAALVSPLQASPFPADGEAVPGIPVEWTYADKHAGDPRTLVGSAIPVSSESYSFPAQSTYAAKHAGESRTWVGSAFPADGEAFPGLQAQSTYADRFAKDVADRGDMAALSE
jgi:hypothetical protein